MHGRDTEYWDEYVCMSVCLSQDDLDELPEIEEKPAVATSRKSTLADVYTSRKSSGTQVRLFLPSFFRLQNLLELFSSTRAAQKYRT